MYGEGEGEGGGNGYSQYTREDSSAESKTKLEELLTIWFGEADWHGDKRVRGRLPR